MVRQTLQYTEPSNRRFYRLQQVKHQVGLGRSAIYSGVQRGTFPAPVNIGARAVAWLSDEIEAWMEARIKASREEVV